MSEHPRDSAAEPVPPATDEAADHCFRCGYDLRGIIHRQPCPECGLLAERSRRKSEHLADASPAWLGRVSVGLRLILWGCLLVIFWSGLLYLNSTVFKNLPLLEITRITTLDGGSVALAGYAVAMVLVLVGLLLFTSPEPSVADDRWINLRRRWLRRLSAAPLLLSALLWGYVHFDDNIPSVQEYHRMTALSATVAAATRIEMFCLMVAIAGILIKIRRSSRKWRWHLVLSISAAGSVCVFLKLLATEFEIRNVDIYASLPVQYFRPPGMAYGLLAFVALVFSFPEWLFTICSIVLISPLPILIFYHIRALARRTLRLNLAEHCAIVGIGTSATFWSAPLFAALIWGIEAWLGEGKSRNSQFIAWVIVLELTAWILFGAWSLLTLARGTRTFRKAAIQRKREWRAADRSLAAS